MFSIYGRNNCIWCDNAKNLLDEYQYEYEFLNIEEDRTALTLFKGYFPGAKTVPQILYNNDEWIGGYTELVEWLKHYTLSS